MKAGFSWVLLLSDRMLRLKPGYFRSGVPTDAAHPAEVLTELAMLFVITLQGGNIEHFQPCAEKNALPVVFF